MHKMTSDQFERVFDDTVKLSRETLIAKAREYADEYDRLHNFNVAASLGHTTPVGALGGMMIKHTVSVYDMISHHEDNIHYAMSVWDEKIMDHINYLILLRAILFNEGNEIAAAEPEGYR